MNAYLEFNQSFIEREVIIINNKIKYNSTQILDLKIYYMIKNFQKMSYA